MLRDRLAWWLATQALKIATPRYRKLLEGTYKYGLAAAIRDEAENREIPKDWL